MGGREERVHTRGVEDEVLRQKLSHPGGQWGDGISDKRRESGEEGR